MDESRHSPADQPQHGPDGPKPQSAQGGGQPDQPAPPDRPEQPGQAEQADGDQGQAGSRERRLIEAALEGAKPASGWPQSASAWFEGAPLPPPGTFPGYDVVREIHRGGQGVVYQAVQLSTRRHVALKVMHAGPFMGSSGRARFEREVQVLGQLNHPNIVRIHDSGVTADGSCFYVMDYISGKPLDKLLEEGQLPIREALRLFAKICDAVNAAHLKGVIHRDLKPSNIRIDKRGEPIVVDFGLAKLAVPDLDDSGSGRLMSVTGQFIGSLPWASPEQAQGSPSQIDVRTDVYSLGVILYQLLTNRFPYEVLGNMRDVLDNILKAEPARPSTIRRQVNDEVETIVLKALSKDRERRYQTAGELGRDVQRFLEGQPIEAKRDSGLYVLRKTLRRYRAAVLLGGGALAALVAFAVVVSVLYAQAQAARDQAQQNARIAQEALAGEARQRELAEARLDEAYALAGTMLTDYYDAIKDLRGATPAKQALAERAVATLEALASHDQPDPQRQLLIGRGRLRLGNLYTGRGELQRLGRPEQGQALFRSALAVADGLLADGGPNTLQALHLRADALAHLAHSERLMRRYDASTQTYQQALSAYERAIDATGDDALAGTLRLAHADAQLELANTLAEHAWTLPEDGADAALRARLLARAEGVYQRGLSAFERLAETLPDAQAARARLGQTRAMVRLATLPIRQSEAAVEDPAKAKGMLASLERAEAMLRQALDTLTALAQADPARGVYASDALVACDALGQLLRQRARIYESIAAGRDRPADDLALAEQARLQAIDVLSQAVDMARRSVQADEANVVAHRTLSHLLNKRARALEGVGRFEQAEADFIESADIRDTLARTDPTGQHLNDAMVGWYYVGLFREQQAEISGQQDTLREALEAFEKARSYAERQIQEGMTTDSHSLGIITGRIQAIRQKLSAG